MTKKLSGPEKAAIFLMSLGEEKAAQVLTEMDESEIQTLGGHLSNIGEVDTLAMDKVHREFFNFVDSGTDALGRGGSEFLRSALSKAFDPQRTKEIINNLSSPEEYMGSGLETLRTLEPGVIASFLENEHPQTAAIILAHLETDVAGKVLGLISEQLRTEVVRRLATLDRVSPQILKELDDALLTEFQTSASVYGNKLGGVSIAAKVLGSMDRSQESGLLAELEFQNPDLANQIRQLKFTFEDLDKLDDHSLQTVLNEVVHEDLLKALKTSSEELKERTFHNLSRSAAALLKEDLESLGPTRISEVEKAQQTIINICKELEKQGKIVFGGSRGEQFV